MLLPATPASAADNLSETAPKELDDVIEANLVKSLTVFRLTDGVGKAAHVRISGRRNRPNRLHDTAIAPST